MDSELRQRATRVRLARPLAAAMLAAALNTGLSLPIDSNTLSFLDLLAVFGTATTFFLVVYMAAAGAVRLLVSGRREPRREALGAAATGCTVISGAGFVLLGEGFGFDDAELAVVGFLVVAAIAATGTTMHLWTRTNCGTSSKSHDRWWALACAVAVELLVVAWYWDTRNVDVLDDVTRLPTVGAAALGAVGLLAILVTLALAQRLLVHRTALRSLLVCYSLTLMLPLLVHALPEAPARTTRPATGEATASGPIILITVDTLRQDALGAYGTGAELTPNLDKLASDSVAYSEARSTASWTKPAVASLMSGLSPTAHGAVQADSVLPEKITTLAEILSSSGHRTGAIGHNGFLTRSFGFDQGFDDYSFFEAGDIASVPIGLRLLRGIGLLSQSSTTAELVDRAITWVGDQDDRHFFLWLHLFDPHLPYEPPGEFLPNGPAPPGFGDRFDALAEVRQGTLALSATERDWVRSLYEAEVRYVDRELGRFLTALRQLGLYEPALLVFTSDHGEEFWDHGAFEHGHTMYSELLRVPLFVKMPHSRHRGDVDVPVLTASVAPTIASRVAASPPGIPFEFPVLPGLRSVPGSPAGYPRDIGGRGTLYYEDRAFILFGGWKYVRSLESDLEELYFLRDDPTERWSRAGSRRDVLERARKLLEERTARSRKLAAELGIGTATGIPIDESTLEGLQSLGYVQ